MWQIISNFLGNIIIIYGVFKFCQIIYQQQIQISNKNLILNFIICASSYTIIMIYFNNTIKTLFFIIIIFIFNKKLCKEQCKKILFITLLYMLLLLLVDVFILFFLTEVLNISKEFCYNIFAGSIIGNISTQIVIIIITLFLKKILRKIINDQISINAKIIIYSSITLLCSTMFLYTIVREYRLRDNVILYLLSIIILITFLFSLIKQAIDNNSLKDKYDKIMKEMTTYENDVENERIMRHEAKNELRTIRAMICEKQKSKDIIEYIDEIVNDKYEIKNEKYAKFGYLPPNGIKGLCYFKTQEAENKKIKVSINISSKVKKSVIYNLDIKQQRDLGRILGVILDNAIEASLESEEKQLGIEAYVTENKKFKFIISNTYNNKIDDSKIGKEKFSTKGKNRGHGLLLVNQLIKKNSIFELELKNLNKIYVSTIIIKNN